jgi:diguanylate cyclase (GGDEF)-like protein
VGRAEGLPESVDALAVDPQHRMWASMDNPGGGIAVIDASSLRVRTLGLADGVSIDQYAVGAATRTPDGTIFFGGLKGVTAIAPQASLGPSYVPPLIVTALSLGRQSVPAWDANRSGASVDLAPGARDITVEFAALDYAAPQSVRYAYELEGYDRDWIAADSAHRIATYTNLPPGRYTLHVRGTNRLGAWSERTLGVTALPAWYETWWFRALLGLLAAAALYGLHVTRTELLRRRQRELEGIVRERTSELRQANAKLEEMSLTDPLTGLRNRRFLTQHIEADVAMALRRYEDALATSAAPPSDAALLFFLVDIDHFKAVNDELGHRAGDLVLTQMRERLQEVFRESDIVVRWGGEEFLAVAHGGWSDALDIAERLRAAVAGRPFMLDGGATLSKTASVGFAAFPFVAAAPRAITWSQVVELADQGLYMAKNGGRNTWFGLAATARTNPGLLERQLVISAEEAVRVGELEIVHPATVKPA